MAAKEADPVFSCDICGENGFTERSMKSHMLNAHLEGAISCPFCDLGDIVLDEMIAHVNIYHLDFSNPTAAEEMASSDSLCDLPGSTNNNNVLRSSPKRSEMSLNLNSKSPDKVTCCPLCDYKNQSPTKLQEHINRQHFDLTSPSFSEFISPDGLGNVFSCPLCSRSFEGSSDLELHVNLDHQDILSPIRSTQVTPGDENSNERCPVCQKCSFSSGLELASHIEEHFDQMSSHCFPIHSAVKENSHGGIATDHLLAVEMEKREREQLKLQEQRDFNMLRAQYGMDGQGNFREQSITNMQRAVYSGEMTVADYYSRQVELRIAELNGVDDSHSCTKGLVPKIRTFSAAANNVERSWICTAVDHYGSTYGDRGWGCGYRNIQIMLSALMHHTTYNHQLFNGKSVMPSISKIQELIEGAWRIGFDPQGCEQLGGKLTNTRKWIGATEVVTFLSSFRIKCYLIDCHCPTGPSGTHPELFCWVKDYFSKDDDFKAPIYLQHHGHSRTVIGVEELTDNSLQLLVLDPSHSKNQMEQFSQTSSSANAMRLIRRPLSSLKARQYQLVAVAGILDTNEEYQASKILRSQRIPPNA